MRYPLYFTPPREHPLTVAAAAWLGRDAFSGAPVPVADRCGLSPADHERLTAPPRRYGFHATIVAPFRPVPGVTPDDMAAAARSFAALCRPFAIRALRVAPLEGFLALVPAQPEAALDVLAAAAVDHFAALRAPLTPAEIERRDPVRLSPRQRAYLERYGYPFVKEEFRFHMTLTDPVAEPDASRLESGLASLFAPALREPVQLRAVSLFVEPEPGAPFTVHSTHPFTDAEAADHA